MKRRIIKIILMGVLLLPLATMNIYAQEIVTDQIDDTSTENTEYSDDEIIIDPDPVPVDPDPVPVEPDPTPVDPDPTPTPEEPVEIPVEPEPTPDNNDVIYNDSNYYYQPYIPTLPKTGKTVAYIPVLISSLTALKLLVKLRKHYV